jgi:dTDP-4-dehydrorhamnose reductase
VNVLLTGASGLVGSRLVAALAGSHRVFAAHHLGEVPAGAVSVRLDLTRELSLQAALDATRADAVVHCAALADADRCEREPALAARLNRDATAALAGQCQRRGLRLLALSTDLVFAGNRSFASEQDAAQPLSVYGRTKLAGEEAALAECPSATVLRLALVTGRGLARPTATESIAWALRAGRRLRLFTDQFRTPVDLESVAPAIARVLAGDWSGRYHLGGRERVSRHELGMRVARGLGLREDLIEAVTQAEAPLAAPRPTDVSLDSSRAARDWGWSCRSLGDAIAAGRPDPG